MWIHSRKIRLTAFSKKRSMWRSLKLSLIFALAFLVEVSRSEDVGSRVLQDEERSNVSTNMLGTSQQQILAAQFECYKKIIHDPPRIQDTGSYCNRTWDGWLCWEDSAPGTIMQMCPAYYNNFNPEEIATKVCDSNGQWFHHPESNRVWTNFTQCEAHTHDTVKVTYSLYCLAMVGHALSIVSLIVCLVIFSYFKSLSCQRISLHKNLFFSFLLNSIITVIWLSLTMTHNRANRVILASYPVSCKVLAVLSQYMAMSNYFWMLCEGIYLHTLIIVAVFVGEQHLFWYYFLGWGFPVVPAITYAVARGFYYNDVCWIGTQTNLPYITHGPIHVALIVNLFFLLNIVRVLITKLKLTHCAESMAYMKVVRATLILIPLLGVQFILFPWSPENRISGAIHNFFNQIFCHFQGLIVAIIFCFCNAEAQTVLKRKWAQWMSAWGKTGWGGTPMNNSHCNYHHNSSITETSRATLSLGHHAKKHFLSEEQMASSNS